MKLMRIVFFTLIINLSVYTAVFGDEIGFSGALAAKYTGNVEVYSGKESELKQSGRAFQIYSVLGNFRLSYLHYEQHAKHERYIMSNDTLEISSALVKNDVLLFMYQNSFFRNDEEGYYDFKTKQYIEFEEPKEPQGRWDFYYHAGLGLFDSSIDYNGMHLTTQGWSEANIIPGIGIAGGLGVKKKYGKSFFGFEMLYVNKKQVFLIEDEDFSDIEVDVSGLLVFVTTGMEF